VGRKRKGLRRSRNTHRVTAAFIPPHTVPLPLALLPHRPPLPPPFPRELTHRASELRRTIPEWQRKLAHLVEPRPKWADKRPSDDADAREKKSGGGGDADGRAAEADRHAKEDDGCDGGSKSSDDEGELSSDDEEVARECTK